MLVKHHVTLLDLIFVEKIIYVHDPEAMQGQTGLDWMRLTVGMMNNLWDVIERQQAGLCCAKLDLAWANAAKNSFQNTVYQFWKVVRVSRVSAGHRKAIKLLKFKVLGRR